MEWLQKRGQDIREKLVSCSRDKYEAAGVD